MKKVIFKCSVDIQGRNIGCKIFLSGNGGHKIYSFELEKYFQEQGTAEVHRTGSTSTSNNLGDIFDKLISYIDKLNTMNIIKEQNNPHY